MNITKKEICDRISKKILNSKPNELKPIVDIFLSEILIILSEEQSIEIRGFGSFKIKDRKAKVGRNPRTGEIVPIVERKIPNFKFSKEAIKIFNSLRE